MAVYPSAAQTESCLLLAVGLLLIAQRWVKYEQVGHHTAQSREEIMHLCIASLVTIRGIVKVCIASKWSKWAYASCVLPVVGSISMYVRFANK